VPMPPDHPATATDAFPLPAAALRAGRRRPAAQTILALLALLVVAAWMVAPGLFAADSPSAADLTHSLSAPSGAHLFGTDELGRDLFSRVVHGTTASLAAALLAVGVALGAGAVLGTLAGFAGGWADDLIARLADILLSVPALLLAMTLVTVLGFGSTQVALAVGLVSVATVTRLMRAEVLRISGADYVVAATVCGRSRAALLFLHVLPNALRPVFALAALEFAGAVLAISSLSFLGFGGQPAAQEWGALIAAGRDYIATAWWLAILPGSVVAAVVLAANVLSQALQRRAGIR
jgi:peptide/nickel transport system permease protein